MVGAKLGIGNTLPGPVHAVLVAWHAADSVVPAAPGKIETGLKLVYSVRAIEFESDRFPRSDRLKSSTQS
jgi:hypothetical protein